MSAAQSPKIAAVEFQSERKMKAASAPMTNAEAKNMLRRDISVRTRMRRSWFAHSFQDILKTIAYANRWLCAIAAHAKLLAETFA